MADNSYRTSNLGPRVSHATTKAFTAGPGHYLFPSWMTVEVDGPANFDGTVDFDGLADFSSVVTMSGNVAVGAAGSRIGSIVKSTVSINPGSVGAQDSASTTATIQTMPADALIISAQPASIWSGAYYDLAITATVSAASTLRIGLANSTITAVAPAAMNWDILWVDPA